MTTPTPPRDVLVQVVAEMRESDQTRGPCYAKDWADRIERALAVQGEVERDAERLDWMCQGQHTMGFSRDGEACWVCFHRDDDEAPKQGPAAYTIREAIDAARTQEKPR